MTSTRWSLSCLSGQGKEYAGQKKGHQDCSYPSKVPLPLPILVCLHQGGRTCEGHHRLGTRQPHSLSSMPGPVRAAEQTLQPVFVYFYRDKCCPRRYPLSFPGLAFSEPMAVRSRCRCKRRQEARALVLPGFVSVGLLLCHLSPPSEIRAALYLANTVAMSHMACRDLDLDLT